jgi:hypothetical protein
MPITTQDSLIMPDQDAQEASSEAFVYRVLPDTSGGATRMHGSSAQTNGKDLALEKLHRPGFPLTKDELEHLNCRFSFEYPYKPSQPLDFISYAAGEVIISGRVRDCIDAIEPGVHQMIPYELVAKKEVLKNISDKRFFLLNCCRREDFIDVDKSHFSKTLIGGRLLLGAPPGGGRAHLLLKKGWRPPGHLWMNAPLVLSEVLSISQELKDELVRIKSEPIDFHPIKLQ